MRCRYHLLVSNHKPEEAILIDPTTGYRIDSYLEWEEWIVLEESEIENYCENHPNMDNVIKVISKNVV